MATYPSYTPIDVLGVAGVAQCQYAIVNSLGYPMGSTGTISNGASRGMGVPTMIKSASGQFPAPRTVNVTGSNGRKRLKFVFTAADLGEFDMQFGAFDLNFYARSNGVKIQTIGDWEMVPLQSDVAPASVQVALLFNIDAQEASQGQFGRKAWYNLFVPLCNVYLQGAAHSEAAEGGFTYRVSPVQSGSTPWGVALTSVTNGATAAAAFGMTSKNPLTMDTFISDGSTPNFTLNYRPAESIPDGNSAFLFRNGAASPITINTLVIASKVLTMASNGTAGDTNIALYEAIPEDLLAA